MAQLVDMAVKIPQSMKTRLEIMARKTKRGEEDLVEKAVSHFLAAEERELAMIQEALDELERYPERLVDGAAIDKWIESLDTENELPPPTP